MQGPPPWSPHGPPQPSYPPQPSQAPYPPPPPLYPVEPFRGTPPQNAWATVQRVRLVAGAIAFGVLVLAAVVVGAVRGRGSAASVDRGGTVSLGSSGTLRYEAGIRPDEANTVLHYARDTGWIGGGGDSVKAVTGEDGRRAAKPSWGTGASGRGRGDTPHLVMERTTGAGVRVIGLVDHPYETAPMVKAYAQKAEEELGQKLGRKVTFVVRVEQKKGAGLEWTDTTWE